MLEQEFEVDYIMLLFRHYLIPLSATRMPFCVNNMAYNESRHRKSTPLFYELENVSNVLSLANCPYLQFDYV